MMDRSLFVPEPGARTILITNERAKLSATDMNGIAIALFAVGGLTVPLNSMAQGHPTAAISAIALICALASTALHFMARVLLRSLR